MTVESYLGGVMIGAVIFAALVVFSSSDRQSDQGDSGPYHCRRRFYPKKHFRRKGPQGRA